MIAAQSFSRKSSGVRRADRPSLRARLDSAVNRFYRLLHNGRIDYTLFVGQ